MRRREKFVVSSLFLSFGLLLVQYVSLDFRYWAVGGLSLLSFVVSAWALSDDLQRHEWLTILPFYGLYAGAVGFFYFLLPENLISRFFIIGLFAIGMYALFLTGNIFSVAKGRTIQLLHAAHAVGLLITLLASLLFTNTIFSLRLPFYFNFALVWVVHFWLVFMSLWSVELENFIPKKIVGLAFILSLVIGELALIFSFYPFSVWNISLFIMAVMYVGLGVLHNYLRDRLFEAATREYSLVAAFIGIMFILLFPYK